MLGTQNAKKAKKKIGLPGTTWETVKRTPMKSCTPNLTTGSLLRKPDRYKITSPCELPRRLSQVFAKVKALVEKLLAYFDLYSRFR